MLTCLKWACTQHVHVHAHAAHLEVHQTDTKVRLEDVYRLLCGRQEHRQVMRIEV